jgi:hypothetical protein
MRRARKSLALVMALAILMACVPPVRVAAESDSTPIGFDALVLRPLGILATVVGAAVFVVSLPFSAPTGSVEHAAEKLVVEPYRFTFERPLGDSTYHYRGSESPGL